jgi:hypothetical protein
MTTLIDTGTANKPLQRKFHNHQHVTINVMRRQKTTKQPNYELTLVLGCTTDDPNKPPRDYYVNPRTFMNFGPAHKKMVIDWINAEFQKGEYKPGHHTPVDLLVLLMEYEVPVTAEYFAPFFTPPTDTCLDFKLI